ncbi:hypothetical protein EYF80_025205 [Liparis tanakae]|uniref:Uncharacterized protein n=1 Tax=Liparis tanakae TaxID=230148 RepID=A0A4Z2HFC9_9TELE|nr:hypothetical protein EYF80_025205 [Liparis tanakae]
MSLFRNEGSTVSNLLQFPHLTNNGRCKVPLAEPSHSVVTLHPGRKAGDGVSSIRSDRKLSDPSLPNGPLHNRCMHAQWHTQVKQLEQPETEGVFSDAGKSNLPKYVCRLKGARTATKQEKIQQ